MRCSAMARAPAGRKQRNRHACKGANIGKAEPRGSVSLPASDDWTVKMNASTTQAREFRPKLGRIAIAIALASALGGFSMTSAFGDEHGDGGHGAKNQDHRAAPARHNYRPQARHRSRYAPRRVYYAPAPMYYAPAPVYYGPQPSPGISLFIPINIR